MEVPIYVLFGALPGDPPPLMPPPPPPMMFIVTPDEPPPRYRFVALLFIEAMRVPVVLNVPDVALPAPPPVAVTRDPKLVVPPAVAPALV